MATVTVTTQATPLAYPSQPAFGRMVYAGNPNFGYFYLFHRNSAGAYEVRRSTDGGGSWSAYASFTRANLIEWSSIVVDRAGYLHVAYRVSDSSTDTIYYRRLNCNTATWGAEFMASAADSNGGVPGATWQGCDITVYRTSNGFTYVAIAGARNSGTAKYGIMIMGITIATDQTTITLKNGMFTGSRDWWTTGAAPGRTTPSLDIEHSGDGITPLTSPSLWVAWGRNSLYMVKLTWNGSGWQGPTSHQTMAALGVAHDYIAGRWEGFRFCMATVSPDDSTMVQVIQRHKGNTSQGVFTTPTHPTGVIRNFAVTYNYTTNDMRVYAVGTSSTVLYYVDWIRETSSWTSWASVVATAVLGATGGQFGVRRGGTNGTSKFDVYTAHTTPSPNTIVHTAQSTSFAPNVATWDTSQVPYTNGGAADVATTLTLDWTFSDPDVSEVQGSYAVSRQIGAGALAYWRASDSTWQATEQQNTSGTTALTLAASWGAGGDANHTYKVKVWDSAAVPAADYSAALVIVPSVKVNPAITAPAAAAVIPTANVTVTWTAAEQTAYRVALKTDPGGVYVHDSGWITGTALSYVVPYEMANSTGWTAEVTTRNTEGLTSTTQTRSFTVSYTVPATPTLAPVGQTALGVLRVTITNPAPSGGQPVVQSQDLYRRVNGDTTDGVRAVAGLASGAVYDDWEAAANTDYQYRARTYGVNGTFQDSAWT